MQFSLMFYGSFVLTLFISPAILADIIVIIHFGWILFMLWGFVIAFCGLFRKDLFDKWLFRTVHFFGMLYISILAVIDKYCPLTIWENELRQKHDPVSAYSGSFIVHYTEKLVYPDVDQLLLKIVTIFVAVFTLAVFLIKPPEKIRTLFGFLFSRFFSSYGLLNKDE